MCLFSRCTISSSLWCIVRVDQHLLRQKPLSLACRLQVPKLASKGRGYIAGLPRYVHLAKPGQTSSPLFLVVPRRGPIKRTSNYICAAQSVLAAALCLDVWFRVYKLQAQDQRQISRTANFSARMRTKLYRIKIRSEHFLYFLTRLYF